MENNEIPKGCKPFNLEAAMNGAEIVTRDGRPVKFGAYNKDAREDCVIIGWVEGQWRSWYVCGRHLIKGKSDCDLFLKSRTVTKWVNVYRHPDGTIQLGLIEDSLHRAKSIKANEFYLKTISFEIKD